MSRQLGRQPRGSLARSKPRPSAWRPVLVDSQARTGTAANTIYAELRRDIISLRRKPGDPILEREIALAHGVSRTPVREALLRLADEQLVEIRPQSGTFVGRIPVRALPEHILVRKALEELTARLAAENARREQVAGLDELIERQRKLAEAGDRDRFHEADEAFHAAVADAAGHPGIWTLIQQVKVQVDRLRRLSLPVPGRMRRTVDEHAAVVRAIEAGDPARAAERMAAHVHGLQTSIGDLRDLNPGYFVEG
jgi:DNA-binding GntR family transcriptional regulator